jgi:CpeT protein
MHARMITVSLILTASAAAPALGPAGCASVAQPPAARGVQADPVRALRTALAGSFDSSAQAARDESYFDIVLHMTPMWTWRDDGPWLYVEQAVATSADRPYRQRVYKLERMGANRVRSRVFVFDEPLTHAGAWKSGSPMSEMSPEDLEERVGCAVLMTYDPATGGFVGSTMGNGCRSELNGSAYATSEVVITPDRIVSWDRGYDATGQQVWGAEKGGYEFVRVAD